DYAVWQRERLRGAALEEQVGWWKERLGGAPPLLEIPTDRPRRPGQSPRAASHVFRLPPGLAVELRDLSRGEGATLFMTLLAGWQALLGRYAAQEDVVVGTSVAGRTRTETEGLIGFFVNTLALRADLSGDPTWRELLRQVRETSLGAFDRQDLPFERLVDELGVERSLLHNPLFQVAFELAHPGGDDERLRLGEVELEPFGGGQSAAKFDLELSVVDGEGPLTGALVYLAALFDAETIARMAGHLEVVLESMAAGPGLRLSEVSLLRRAERAQVVEEWNATERDFPRGSTLHKLLAGRAALTPTAPAAVSGDTTLSWAELEARSASLAAVLRARGVGPEVCVGVCLERSCETAVALLAVLRAGGAWLPLDPGYPAERLGWMLRDSGARLVLAHEPTAGRLAAGGPEVLLLDGGWEAHAPAPLPLEASGAGPQNLAYVIYTSGSTGRPKGVAVPHRAAVNFATDMVERLRLGSGDRVLQFASPGFDVVVEEIFPAWLAGAAVVFSRAELLAPRELTEEIVRRGVSAVEL
ncbi:MAG TPA: condensation domain-containing protein, partial [Longimicrobiaceae bacterium]|nr:condensation domain-containing protein [Longimicrobiaceae bacterium]